MKKLFMALMAVATIAMVGCKKNDPTPTPGPQPGPTGDFPTMNAVAGKYVIAIQLNGPICQGAKIAFPNKTKLEKDDKWEEALDKIDYMEALTTDDAGKDFSGKNWYKITIECATDSFQGKPVMILDGANALDWSYQTGDEKAWKVLQGEVLIAAGYAGESNQTYLKSGAVYVLTCDYWKNEVDPCNINVFPKVKWTVYMPEAPEGGYPDTVKVVPYIHGNFDGWKEGHEMQKASDGVYTFEYSDVAEGCEYQFTLGGDWDYKAIWTDGEGNMTDANFKVVAAEEEQAPDMFAKQAPAPESSEVWIKCAGNDWTPAKMTETDTKGTFEYETTVKDAANVGANIGVNEAMTGAEWMDLGNAEKNGLAVGDTYKYRFVQEAGVKGTLTIIPANK